jgi:hypothetical protein
MVNMIGIPASILHLEKSKELLEQVARGPVEVGQLHEIFQVDVNCFAVSIYSKKFPLCFALLQFVGRPTQVLAQTCLTLQRQMEKVISKQNVEGEILADSLDLILLIIIS